MTVPSSEPFDAVTIGETMVAFVGQGDGRDYLAIPAGAESNVAAGMALLGCRSRWVSRLGADPLGRLVEEEVAARGVDVAVERDGVRPTGVMTKHVTATGAERTYYRSESAARGLSVDDLHRVGETRWLHVSGITAALSETAAGLVEAIVDRQVDPGPRVSFDVNLRPVLWPDLPTAADTLLSLARRADLVFIGDDEAEALLDTSDAATLADLILRRDEQELVLKRGSDPASVVTADGEVSVPALAVDVVDLVGAGDAFAAGYLAACSRDWPVDARLRLGHTMGARVVTVLADIPPSFTPQERDALSPETLAAHWAD